MTDTERLISLSKADPGFYILAIHSYIENTIKTKYPEIEDAIFWKMMDEYKSIIVNKGLSPRDLDFIYNLKREHPLTNKVRHQFDIVSRNEAEASTWNFLRFIKMEGMESYINTNKIRKLLQNWDTRIVPVEEKAVTALKNQLSALNKKHKSFLKEYESYKETAELVQLYENQIIDLNERALQLSKKIERKDDKARHLRQERFDLQNKLKKIEKQRKAKLSEKKQFGNFDKYLDILIRLSSISRSRLDFERQILKNTPEQQRFINEIDFTKDILIKGSAGTGKSLVLLKSMEKLINLQKKEPNLSGNKILFLTYTNTLTKYNTYLSEVMKIKNTEKIVTTALGFLESKLQEIEKDSKLDFTLWNRWRKEFCPSFMDPYEFQNEIENFIWALDLSKEEYLEETIPGTQLRENLQIEQREKIWKLKLKIETEISPEYTRASAAVCIKKHLKKTVPNYPTKSIDYLFIDESQDMLPVELFILKKMTLHSVILAGDTGQSIYQTISPYSRDSFQFAHNTKILHTNFRNTIPIHKFAETFREKIDIENDNNHSNVVVFREGPEPEIYAKKENQHLSELLINKIKVFIEEVGYAPENIGILIPSEKVRGRLEDGLEKMGYKTVWIKDNKFNFSQEGSIRLCPIHSSKGLDFPVVMLYLPFLAPTKNSEENIKQRNLLYVALTRAMDNLNIFVDPEKNHVLLDLVNSLEVI